MSNATEIIEQYRIGIANLPRHQHLIERYRTAYLEMVKNTGYRPAALDWDMDPAELVEIEAFQYAIEFYKQDESGYFEIGLSDSNSNRAFSWAIEAARICCGGDKQIAVTLLRMAADELVKEYDLPNRGDTL